MSKADEFLSKATQIWLEERIVERLKVAHFATPAELMRGIDFRYDDITRALRSLVEAGRVEQLLLHTQGCEQPHRLYVLPGFEFEHHHKQFHNLPGDPT